MFYILSQIIFIVSCLPAMFTFLINNDVWYFPCTELREGEGFSPLHHHLIRWFWYRSKTWNTYGSSTGDMWSSSKNKSSNSSIYLLCIVSTECWRLFFRKNVKSVVWQWGNGIARGCSVKNTKMYAVAGDYWKSLPESCEYWTTSRCNSSKSASDNLLKWHFTNICLVTVLKVSV